MICTSGDSTCIQLEDGLALHVAALSLRQCRVTFWRPIRVLTNLLDFYAQKLPGAMSAPHLARAVLCCALLRPALQPSCPALWCCAVLRCSVLSISSCCAVLCCSVLSLCSAVLSYAQATCPVYKYQQLCLCGCSCRSSSHNPLLQAVIALHLAKTPSWLKTALCWC